MDRLALYIKEGLSFARDLSVLKFEDSWLCLRLALLHLVSLFLLYGSLSFSLHIVFDTFSSNKIRFPQSVPLLRYLSLGALRLS